MTCCFCVAAALLLRFHTTAAADGAPGAFLEGHTPSTAEASFRGLPNRMMARFTLRDKDHYEVPIWLGASRGFPKKGNAEQAAMGAAAAILCAMLITVFTDVMALAKEEHRKRQRQKEAEALKTKRLAGLASMRQAAELLLHLEQQIQPPQKKQPFQRVQDHRLSALAASIETSLYSLKDCLPETVALGGLLIDRLLLAAGAETTEQQQLRRQQHLAKQKTRKKEMGWFFEEENLDPPTVLTPANRSAVDDEDVISSSSMQQKENPVLDLEFEEKLGPRWNSFVAADKADGTARALLKPLADPLDDFEEGLFLGEEEGPRGVDLLAGILSENRDLAGKDALLIAAAIQRPVGATRGAERGEPALPQYD